MKRIMLGIVYAYLITSILIGSYIGLISATMNKAGLYEKITSMLHCSWHTLIDGTVLYLIYVFFRMLFN